MYSHVEDLGYIMVRSLLSRAETFEAGSRLLLHWHFLIPQFRAAVCLVCEVIAVGFAGAIESLVAG
jgi:hypothetical protein